MSGSIHAVQESFPFVLAAHMPGDVFAVRKSFVALIAYMSPSFMLCLTVGRQVLLVAELSSACSTLVSFQLKQYYVW
jgi:hypothetical protein